jgi:UDP-D-galactose:(glucosyl)LPS alpha-1,3-D-galactosyltransferase
VTPLGVLMESLAIAHGAAIGELRLVVGHRDLDAAQCREIEDTATSIGLSVEVRRMPRQARFPVSGWVSEAVYLRLALPELLPGEPRALYLDVDTLVLRDLRPLLRRELDGQLVAAVRDPQNPLVGWGHALPGWQTIGVPHGREYFNSGVMLFDLAACASSGVFEQAYRFLTDHPDEVRLWDQDALNVAVSDRWLRLPTRWNTFAISALLAQPDFLHYAEPVTPLAELLADEYTAAVLHFAGPAKPWNDDYPTVPLRTLYRRFQTAAARRLAASADPLR